MRPDLCALAAKESPTAVELRSICERSRIALGKPVYPGIVTQARNLAGAVGRVAAAVAHGEQILVETDVFAQRLAICRSCEHNGDPVGVHCKLCGCRGAKLMLASEQCPDNPPRWLKVTS
jgi:hypothetical protein